MLSQMSRAVMGGGPYCWVLQFATAAILVLAANTAYADFPGCTSIIACDGYPSSVIASDALTRSQSGPAHRAGHRRRRFSRRRGQPGHDCPCKQCGHSAMCGAVCALGGRGVAVSEAGPGAGGTGTERGVVDELVDVLGYSATGVLMPAR